jgi:hypothetical protein
MQLRFHLHRPVRACSKGVVLDYGEIGGGKDEDEGTVTYNKCPGTREISIVFTVEKHHS